MTTDLADLGKLGWGKLAAVLVTMIVTAVVGVFKWGGGADSALPGLPPGQVINVGLPYDALDPADPANLGRLASPGDGYAYVERASAIALAIGDSRPDYAYMDGDAEIYSWETPGGWRRDVEPLAAGQREYFYAPGEDQPFLIRDPQNAYGFDRGALVTVINNNGVMAPPEALPRYAEPAGLYLAHAEGMAGGAAEGSRHQVSADRWEARSSAVASEQARWVQASEQQPAWRAYRQQSGDSTRKHFAAEKGRRDRSQAWRAVTGGDRARPARQERVTATGADSAAAQRRAQRQAQRQAQANSGREPTRWRDLEGRTGPAASSGPPQVSDNARETWTQPAAPASRAERRQAARERAGRPGAYDPRQAARAERDQLAEERRARRAAMARNEADAAGVRRPDRQRPERGMTGRQMAERAQPSDLGGGGGRPDRYAQQQAAREQAAQDREARMAERRQRQAAMGGAEQGAARRQRGGWGADQTSSQGYAQGGGGDWNSRAERARQETGRQRAEMRQQQQQQQQMQMRRRQAEQQQAQQANAMRQQQRQAEAQQRASEREQARQARQNGQDASQDGDRRGRRQRDACC